MQKTNFAFELIIHDDASTDGTADIIREYEAKYPDIVKPIYQTENQYCKRIGISRTYIYPRVKGKYIALCEGDDYWIDPYKLQKQVDFLEKNDEYALCFTAIKVLNFDKTLKDDYIFSKDFTPTIDDIIVKNCIPTLTTLFRTDYIFRYYDEVNPVKQRWRMGDYPLWIWMSLNSKIKYLSDITSVYRCVQGSLSHCKDVEKQITFFLNTIDIRKFFKERYNISEKSYLKGVAFAYKQCRTLAMDNDMWNIIKEDMQVMKRLNKWDKYIKLKIFYINRSNKKALSFLRKHL